jgi:hypothetical protein
MTRDRDGKPLDGGILRPLDFPGPQPRIRYTTAGGRRERLPGADTPGGKLYELGRPRDGDAEAEAAEKTLAAIRERLGPVCTRCGYRTRSTRHPADCPGPPPEEDQ